MASCVHLDHIRVVTPRNPGGCEESLKAGRYVGAPAPVPGVRTYGVLRLIQKQACKETLAWIGSPDHAVLRTRRNLGLVLPRSG